MTAESWLKYNPTYLFSPSSTDNLCEANEAYQFLIKKRLKQSNEKRNRLISNKWHVVGEKTYKALGVIGTLTAAQNAKQRFKEDELVVTLFIHCSAQRSSLAVIYQ